jgi:hypothetical protein
MSVEERLKRLEDSQRFIDWIIFERFLESLDDQQLETFARDGCLPDPLPAPLPKGTSRLDGLGRKNLVKLWQEKDRAMRHRRNDELAFFTKNGHWAEQRIRLRYILQGGSIAAEWQVLEEGDREETNSGQPSWP